MDCGKDPPWDGKRSYRLWTPLRRALPKGSSCGGRKVAARPQDRRCRATQETAIRTIWKAAWSNSVPCGRSPHIHEYNPKRFWSRIQQLTYLRRITPVYKICISECRRKCPSSRFPLRSSIGCLLSKTQCPQPHVNLTKGVPLPLVKRAPIENIRAFYELYDRRRPISDYFVEFGCNMLKASSPAWMVQQWPTFHRKNIGTVRVVFDAVIDVLGVLFLVSVLNGLPFHCQQRRY